MPPHHPIDFKLSPFDRYYCNPRRRSVTGAQYGIMGDGVPQRTTFEVLLDSVGHFGRYQLMIFVLVRLLEVMTGMIMMFFVFATTTPPWKCSSLDGMNASSWIRYSPQENSQANISEERLSEACLLNETKCDAMDFSADFVTIVSEWSLVCDFNYIPNLTTSILMFGVLVGAFVSGQLSDIYGRKSILMIAGFLLSISQVLVGFSVSWEMFAALRFVVGIFLGGTLGLVLVIPMEFIGPKWRSLCGCLSVFDFGFALMVLVAYLLPDWRHQAFVSGAIWIPILIANLIFVPESVRWLIQKQRFDQAECILRKMATVNRKPLPDMQLLKKMVSDENTDDPSTPTYGYVDLFFASRKLSVRTMVMAFCCFTSSSLFYGLIVSMGTLSSDIYLNSLIAIGLVVPLNWTIIPVANWIGRKKTYVIYSSIATVTMVAIVILNAVTSVQDYSMLVSTLALMGRAGIASSWTLIGLYCTEIYPTLMRTVGVGIANTSSRIGGIVAPQFVTLGLLVHWTVPYVINGGLALASALLVLFLLPETNKCPLPEELPPKRRFVDYMRCKCCGNEAAPARVTNKCEAHALDVFETAVL